MQERNDMQQNSALSPAQEIAIDAIVSGKSMTAAADDAGVDRSTIYRWSIQHQFGSELNERRRHLRDGAFTQLLAATETAVENVRRAIDEGDVKASYDLLKTLGVLTGKFPDFEGDGFLAAYRRSSSF